MKNLLRAALLATVAVGATPVIAQPAKPAALAPIAYTTRTLANGLRVYAIRDTGTANVSVQVWYDVGSKDDPKDRSGFAHLFEHLMFKATRNLKADSFDRLTEDVGGYNNASTEDDYTNYYEVVPANHLERLLFAEADRMASLIVDAKTLASERDVVKEELRLRILAQPYGKLFGLYYPMVAYSTHPYARPGIGSIENLDAASVDDVRAFHATYYRPDNAVLVVAGNFDPAQLDRWVDKYFAPIARPARAIPRVAAIEPARTTPTRYTVYEANVPLPAVLISWHLPPDRDPDMPALQVLDAILATGESSRLYRSLVYRDGLAQSAQTFLDTKQGIGNLAAIAIIAGGKDAATGEAALRREIARLRETPVTAAELAEAKNELLTAALKERETAEGKASVIAGSVLIDGAPDVSDRQVAQVANVTAADVQRVARKYLTDNRSATIHYLPATPGTKGDTIGLAPTVQVAALTPPADIPVVTFATDAERVLPPAPGPLVTAVLPQPQSFTLANGLKVVAVPKPGQPIVSALLVADGGGVLDRPGASGTASVTAEVMTKGTARYTASQLAAATEALGTSLISSAGHDSATLAIVARSSELTPALGILAEVAMRPRFAADELTRARAQAIDSAKLNLSDPGSIAEAAAARLIFGNAGYGAPLDGTPVSLAAIRAEDLPATWRSTWRPDHTSLILVGDVTVARARALAEQNFAKWAPPAMGVAARVGAPTTPPAPRVVVIDMPDAGQAAVAVARPGISRRDPAYYDTLVANATLGLGLSSRLGTEIRVKRGLAYGADASLFARRDGGLEISTTQTKNPSAVEVLGLILGETKKLAAEATGNPELDARKAILTGSFGRNIETTAGIATTLGQYLTQRIPLTTLKDFPDRVNAVTADAMRSAAARYLDPAPASIIVVGNAKEFLEPLRKLYPALEVIPIAQLNLDTAALK